MNTEATVTQVPHRRSNAYSRARRFFHLAAALAMLLVMLIGFWPFYLAGEGMGGRPIDPAILTLVIVHGGFMTAWVLVFACQALLIATHRQRWHRASGRWGVVVAIGVAVSAVWVAIASVRMPVLFPMFGEAGWWGIFGPIFTLGAVFVVAHSLLLRSFDRWLAGAFAFRVVSYVTATGFATSTTWSRLAGAVFGV
jgi:hypothetical protein